jgi:hypothetical protein
MAVAMLVALLEVFIILYVGYHYYHTNRGIDILKIKQTRGIDFLKIKQTIKCI